MNKRIEELRDLSLEIDELKRKKEEVKRKALEHRSAITNEEMDKIFEERARLEKEIKEKEERKATLMAEAEDENQGEERIMNNELLHYKDGMERAEIHATAEYRSAYFKKLQGKDLTDVEQRSITSAANSGGAAIPTVTMNEIIGQLRESPTVLGLITMYNIPDLVSIPKENVVNDASWLAEDSDSTNSDDTLTNISLAAHKLIKTIKVTAKVKAMAVDAFEEWVVNAIVRKMRAACEKAIFSGTGANQPTGLDTATWDEKNSVEVGAAAALTYDNLVDLEALVGEDFLANSVWVMNRKMRAQVMKLKDDQKRPLFERAIEDGFNGSLLGYPVRLCPYVKDNEVYFGDWKSAYVMNFAQAIELASSKEAGFMSGATVYRGLALVDGKPTGVTGAMVKLKKAAVSGG